jgi:aldose 1-epimerase
MKATALLALLFALAANAANYSARQAVVDTVDVVILADAARKTEVTILPSIGNMAYELKVNGKNVLYVPEGGLAKFKARPSLNGIPFLAPWGNRLDQPAFFANGKKYIFNMGLGNVRGNIPMHGFLTSSPAWKVAAVKADGKSAWVTSRLEFWKYPDMMAQFPFAHTIEMTYRLREGVLQVETVLHNQSVEPMPVSIGFHPYFRLAESPRDKWKIHVPVRDHWVVDRNKIPTGQIEPAGLPDPLLLEGRTFDDYYSNLIRGADGKAEFWIQGEKEKLSVLFGPKYTVCVLYVPAGGQSLCFEPMAAMTNAMNMAQAGTYKELQSIPPGGEWRESFWVRPSGF